MIILDLNQTMISNLMAQLGSHTNVEVKEDLLRHMVLNAIRSYRSKFTAEYGEISAAGGGDILMTNVIAQIDLFKKDTIYLSSDFAKYNTLTLDTNFNKDVVLEYTGHKINSENIDLSFEENFAWIYNNVVYKSSINKLFADRLEIDLLTKDSKIFMYDDKKLKITGK